MNLDWGRTEFKKELFYVPWDIPPTDHVRLLLSGTMYAHIWVFSLCGWVGPSCGRERQGSLAKAALAGSVVAMAVRGFRRMGLGFQALPCLSYLSHSELPAGDKARPVVPPQRTFHKLLPLLWATILPLWPGELYLPQLSSHVTSSVKSADAPTLEGGGPPSPLASLCPLSLL